VQKRLNLSIRHFDCGLEWAEGCTSSIVFARWRQCALVEGHVAVTCRITLNHPFIAAMRLMANYFDHLLSLDTPTYTVAQIAKHFEPSTGLWAFHTMQPSSFIFLLSVARALCLRFKVVFTMVVGLLFAITVRACVKDGRLFHRPMDRGRVVKSRHHYNGTTLLLLCRCWLAILSCLMP